MTTPNRPALKGALIGYGTAGQAHGRVYLNRAQTSKDVVIVAIADICDGRRQVASAEFPEAQVYTDADILFEREARGLDFVDIAIPPMERAAFAMKAMKWGLNVICEAPVALAPEEAEMLSQRAAQEKKVLYPYVPSAHAAVFQSAKEAMEKRIIGKLRAVSIEVLRENASLGVPEWNPEWRKDKLIAGGGAGVDDGFAALYSALDWMGSKPTHISAKMDFSQKKELEDGMIATITFPNGIVNVRVSQSAGIRKTMHLLNGESGALTIDNDNLEIAVMQKVSASNPAHRDAQWSYDKKEVPSEWNASGHPSWFASAFDRFKQALEKNDVATKELALSSTASYLLSLAYRSAKENCREIFVEGI